MATTATDKLLEEVKKSGKRVIVTGGFGYIGSELVKQLEKHSIDCLSVDKKNPPGRRSIRIDLCDKEAAASAIKKFRPDIFVHCGTNSALAYRDHFLESFRDDAAALANILEALSQFPACRLICFSSSYVYSGLDIKKPVNEAAILNPSHNFGVAKSFFEQLVLRVHPGTVVFRLSSVFGPGNALNPNAVFGMAKECLKTGQLTVWGTGSRKMQYVYMSDVLAGICEAFALEPGIYNLGGREYIPVAESAKMIAEFFGAKVTFLKDKKEGETLPFMDCSKLRRAPANSITLFSDSLNEYLGLIRENFK